MNAKAVAAEEAWIGDRSAAGRHSPWLIAVVISIATFMEVLDTSIANVSLGHIAGSLSVTYDEATWALTSYLVANAIVVPISGWLSEHIGRKRYYMLSVALFTLSSLACGLSPSIGFLIFARILQGIGGGGLAPSEQSMLADTFPPSKRGLAFSIYGVNVVVGPAIGPTLGGWITDHFSWNWIFFINIPIGLLSLLLVALLVAEPATIRRERRARLARGVRFDSIGFALVALGLGFLEVALDRGEHDDWFQSPMITAFLAIAAVALVALVLWELRVRDPVVDVRLLGRRNFLVACILMLAAGAFLYGGMQCIAQLLQQIMGYTATSAGLALTAGAVVALATTAIAGELPTLVQPRVLIGIGVAMEAFAFWNLTHMSAEVSFWAIAGMRIWQAAALPLILVPLTVVSYVGLPASKSEEASALVNMFRNLGGTIGISLVQTVLSRRFQFHTERLGEHVTARHDLAQEIARLGAALAARGESAATAGQQAMGAVVLKLQQQAGVLAYVDVYWCFMAICLALLPLTLLLRKTPKGMGIQAL